MRNEIRAGPNSIQYKEFSHYFFEAGLRLAKLKRRGDEKMDRDDLVNTLRLAFADARYIELMNRALARTDGQSDNTEYSLKLTACELKLFHQGQNAARDIHRWRQGDSWKIEPSVLVRKNQFEDQGIGKRAKY